MEAFCGYEKKDVCPDIAAVCDGADPRSHCDTDSSGRKIPGIGHLLQGAVPGSFDVGIYSPIGNTLLSVGKVKYNVVSNIVVLSIQVIMNVMLIPVMGIMGMAISYVAGGTGAAVVNQIMLNRVFRDYKS